MPRYTPVALQTRVAEATFLAKNQEHVHAIAQSYFTADCFAEVADDYHDDSAQPPS